MQKKLLGIWQKYSEEKAKDAKADDVSVFTGAAVTSSKFRVPYFSREPWRMRQVKSGRLFHDVLRDRNPNPKP